MAILVEFRSKQRKLIDTKNGFAAQFALPREQLNSSPTHEITYVLLIRYQNKWIYNFAIQRRDLADILAERLEKNGKAKTINVSLTVSNTRAKCGKTDFTDYQQLSDLFPEITH